MLLSSVAACRAAHPRDADLVFAADQLGYLAPCGCSQHQLGGAARASAFLLDMADGGPTAFLEGGNLLFGEQTIPAEKRQQDTDKAEALVKSWQVGADAMPSLWASGPFDDALGPAVRTRAFVGTQPLRDPALLHVGGISVGVLALKDASDPAAAETLRRQGAQLVIALVQGPWRTASSWAESADADLALQSGVLDPIQDTDEGAQTGGHIPAFRVKDKGRGVLTLHMHLPKDASGVAFQESVESRKARAAELDAVIRSNQERLKTAAGGLQTLLQEKIKDLESRRASLLAPPPEPPADKLSFGVRFIDLTEQLPEAPAAEQIFRAYTAETGKKNLAAQASKACPAPKANELHYVGASSCKGCHESELTFYSHMKHAQATQTLVDKGRQYDLDCVGCHVLGYGKPGGACRLDRVAADGAANVQCESCHGMASAHVENPGKTLPPEPKPGYDSCVRCHDADNDTGFNRQTFVSHYLPEIVGPGHGRPGP